MSNILYNQGVRNLISKAPKTTKQFLMLLARIYSRRINYVLCSSETTAPLVVEEGSQCHTSAAGNKSFTLSPESPNSTEEGCGKVEVTSDSINAEECLETSAKRKIPPSKVSR